MPSVLTPASGLISSPDDAAARSRAGMKALVLGSFIWIVLVSSAAWMLNRYSQSHPETFTPVSAKARPASQPSSSKQVPALFFANPFDRSEVFEFPPGTSESDARAAVAEFLIDRARGRVGQFQHVTRVAEVRSASMMGEMPTGH